MEILFRVTKIWHGFIARIRLRPLIALLLLFLVLAYILPLFGAYDSLLSPSVYPALAPSGWRNITPHGKIVLFSYAASSDEPGLMVACGSLFTITLNNLSTWKIGGYHDWLSKDGGATWALIDTPFDPGEYCGAALPSGAHGTIVQSIASGLGPSSGASAVWISHDEGRSWARRPQNGYDISIGSWIYRNGALYGQRISVATNDVYFSRSTDDGLTWTDLSEIPDSLVGDGEVYESYVPDFRHAHAWYGEVIKPNQSPMLIATQDDGVSWAEVAHMPASKRLLLTTSPLAPDHVCAVPDSFDSASVRVLAGSDGGRSWRVGAPPASISIEDPNFVEPSFGSAMDRAGNCYLGLHYGNSDTKASHFLFLQQSPLHDGAQIIPVAESVNSLGDTLIVPDGDHNQLIFESLQNRTGWAGVLTNLAGGTPDNLLLARTVP